MPKVWPLRPKPNWGSTRANAALRGRLQRYGDDGLTPRHVVHAAHPSEATEATTHAELAAALEARGFTVEAAGEGFALNHVVAVAGDGFDALTSELALFLRGRGWRYAGWTCRAVGREPQL